MNDEAAIVYGPVVGGYGRGTIIYSVTLGNGYVVTSPGGFGQDSPLPPPATPRPLPSHDPAPTSV
jgi:hypothetical protein